jgi:hypothetical protein
LKNTYPEVKLKEKPTCRDFWQVRIEGNIEITRTLPHYYLELPLMLS